MAPAAAGGAGVENSRPVAPGEAAAGWRVVGSEEREPAVAVVEAARGHPGAWEERPEAGTAVGAGGEAAASMVGAGLEAGEEV